MAEIRCTNCYSAPLMKKVHSNDPSKSTRYGAGHALRNAGHPAIATVIGVFGLVRAATGMAVGAGTYECPNCGSTRTISNPFD